MNKGHQFGMTTERSCFTHNVVNTDTWSFKWLQSKIFLQVSHEELINIPADQKQIEENLCSNDTHLLNPENDC